MLSWLSSHWTVLCGKAWTQRERAPFKGPFEISDVDRRTCGHRVVTPCTPPFQSGIMMPMTTHRRIGVWPNVSQCNERAAAECVVLWHLGIDQHLVESSTTAFTHRRSGAHATEKVPRYRHLSIHIVPPDSVSSSYCSLQQHVGTVCTVCHMLQRLFHTHSASTSIQNPAAEKLQLWVLPSLPEDARDRPSCEDAGNLGTLTQLGPSNSTCTCFRIPWRLKRRLLSCAYRSLKQQPSRTAASHV